MSSVLVALPPIEQPTPIGLTFDFIKDVSNFLDNFLAGNRVHRDEDVRFISHNISEILNEYKRNTTSNREFNHLGKHEHFIRVLRYGVLFKYAVLLKLPNSHIEEIIYEY